MTTPVQTAPAANGGEFLARLDAWLDPLTKFLKAWRYALIALVALAQAGVLMHMVAGREQLLANGRQIDLKVVPVDPRDFFRGDYVTLGYDISRLPETLLRETAAWERGDRIFVTLQRRGDVWEAVSAGRGRPLSLGADEVVITGRVRYAHIVGTTGSGKGTVDVAYGIEKFFVPEGLGRSIETNVQAKMVIAHVAVAADGTAAIRALTVDGERLELEPLF